MKIIQINVRLSEGGAAGVAAQLHLGLIDRGFESIFIYGYGKGAERSVHESKYKNVFMLAQKHQVMSNYLVNKIFNIDKFPPSNNRTNFLLTELRTASVVHLHVVHSHFVSLSWLGMLINECKSLGVPVVWTLHDHWIITGRCAFTDGCQSWMTGCGSCPSLKNYPAVWFDNSANVLREKRQFFANFSKDITFVSPSVHLANDVRSSIGIDPLIIPNGLDNSFFNLNSSLKDNSKLFRVLIVANDLSYEGKTDRSWAEALAGLKNVEVHCVGHHSPFDYENFVNHGPIFDRSKLFDLWSTMDAMLFTSIVDNYPMVIVESLSLGIPVLAKESPAASEILGEVGGVCLKSTEELKLVLGLNNIFDLYGGKNNATLKLEAKKVFGEDSMLNNYIDLYRSKIA
nr:glycosyltransferase [uncultured Albidiferax sp.]